MRFKMPWITLLLIGIVVLGIIVGKISIESSPQSNEEETTQTLIEFFTDSDTPILEHPDTLQVYFPDSITEHDRELITLAIEISQPLFEEMGIPFTMNVYVADTKNTYVDLYQRVFHTTAKDALEQYDSARATASYPYGNVLINIPLNDRTYSAKLRDAAIFFATLHEFYHIAQAKLSEGFVSLMNDPLSETSANLGAARILFDSFCISFKELENIGKLLPAQDCDPDFVKEQILDYWAISYFSSAEQTNLAALYAIDFYVIKNYGLDGYDDLYRALATLAKEMPAGDDAGETARDALWPEALQVTFGVRSLEELGQNALAYVTDRREQIISDFEKKYPELFTE